jgi:hypothetical protein
VLLPGPSSLPPFVAKERDVILAVERRGRGEDAQKDAGRGRGRVGAGEGEGRGEMSAGHILNGVKVLDGTIGESDRAWMRFDALDSRSSFDVQRAK